MSVPQPNDSETKILNGVVFVPLGVNRHVWIGWRSRRQW